MLRSFWQLKKRNRLIWTFSQNQAKKSDQIWDIFINGWCRYKNQQL